MSTIEVEPGVRLYVQDVGGGPCVVLLHGWALGHQIWDRQVRVLVESGRRVIAIDLRGHGRSDAPYGDYSVERLADDVTTILESLDARDVALVGWSLGGLVAFRVAATRHEKIRKLVLVGSNGVANARKAGFPFGLTADEQRPRWSAREKANRIASRRELIIGAFAQAPDPVLADWLLQVSLQTPSWVGRRSPEDAHAHRSGRPAGRIRHTCGANSRQARSNSFPARRGMAAGAAP